MYSVSSNYQLYAAQHNAKWQRRFTIGDSDYSGYVNKWPSISKQWDKLSPQTVTINLSNEGKTFNFLSFYPTQMRNNSVVDLGFNFPNVCQYSEEWTNAAWVKTNCAVTSVTGGFKVTKTTSGNATARAAVYSSGVSLGDKTFNLRGTLWVDSAAVNSGYVNIYILAPAGAVIALKTVNPLPTTPTEYRLSGTLGDVSSQNIAFRFDPAGTCSGWGYYGNFAMCEEGRGDSPYNVTSSVAPYSEYITMFAGTIDAARFAGGGCDLTLIDKFRRLSDRKIGDSTSAVNYTDSSYLIHDMAWYACTSLGGLSAIASTSNPDLDYTSFNSWTSVFSADNVRCRASLTGQQPIEMLRKLALLTQSALYIEDDRIKFNRFTITGSDYITLDASAITDATASLDDRELVNKAWVSGAYDTSSKSFGLTVYSVDSPSQVDYGLRENLVAETFVWLVDSVSALNLAQRTTTTNAQIQNKYQVSSTLASMRATLGDTVLFEDTLMDVSDTFRVMSETVDMDTGKKSFGIDQSQFFGAFKLDISALDSSDVLT